MSSSTPYPTGRLQFVGQEDDLGVKTFAMSFWPQLPMGIWQQVNESTYFPLSAAMQLAPVEANPGDDLTIWSDGEALFFGETEIGGGAAPGQWTDGAADELWNTAGNWAGAAVPTSATDVIMGGVTNENCSLAGTQPVCKSIDFTDYTGELTQEDIEVHGDVTMDSGVIAGIDRIYFNFKANGTYLANGFTKGKIAADTAVTVTLGDSCTMYSIATDCTLAWSTKVITISNGSGSEGLEMWGSGTISYAAGAKLRFTGDAVYFLCDSGTTTPPVELDAALVVMYLDDVKCASWTQAGGAVDGNNNTVEVVGDFVATGGSLTDVIAEVGGAVCTAADMTITGCDFSGGTTLDATDNCIDGGGNTNVDFGVPTQWTNIGGDNLWENAANWTLGVPTASLRCLLGGVTNAECILPDGNQECRALDLTGYSGNFHVAAQLDANLNVYGNVTLSSACTTVGHIFTYIIGDCQYTSGGFPRCYPESDDTTTQVFTAMDNASCFEFDLGSECNLGAFVYTFDDTSGSDGGGCYLYGPSAVVFAPGGKFVFANTSFNGFECDTPCVAPPIEVTSSAGCEYYGNSSVYSWTQSDGPLTQPTGTDSLTVVQNFLQTGGSIDDCNIIVGGTAVAQDLSSIQDADFTGGTTLDATDNCVDDGGNINVDFVPTTRWISTGSTSWVTGANWTNGVPDASKRVVFGSMFSNVDCHMPAMAACTDLLLTDYTGELSGGSLAVGGDITSTDAANQATFASTAMTIVGDVTVTGTTFNLVNLTVGGNLLLASGSIDSMAAAITGTCVAQNVAIQGADFSGGTTCNAAWICVDNGSNTNVLFVAQWTNVGADNLWTNGANWNLGVPPVNAYRVVMAGVTNDDCIVPDGGAECRAFDGTGYTGNISDAGSGNVNCTLLVYANVELDAGISTPGYIRVEARDTVQLISGGFPKVWAVSTFAGSTTLEFMDNCNLYRMNGTAGTFDFNTFTMTLADSPSIVSIDGCTIVYSAGAKLLFTDAAGCTIRAAGLTGGELPPLEFDASVGSGAIIIETTRCKSWTQNGGNTENSGAMILTVVDNFLATAGNIVANNPGSIQLNAGGTCQDTAGAGSTVTNVNCTGTAMTATGCTDGGGNTNVNF